MVVYVTVTVQNDGIVFAGDLLECSITFTNVGAPFSSSPSTHQQSSTQQQQQQSLRHQRSRSFSHVNSSTTSTRFPREASIQPGGIPESTLASARESYSDLVGLNGKGLKPNSIAVASNIRASSFDLSRHGFVEGDQEEQLQHILRQQQRHSIDDVRQRSSTHQDSQNTASDSSSLLGKLATTTWSLFTGWGASEQDGQHHEEESQRAQQHTSNVERETRVQTTRIALPDSTTTSDNNAPKPIIPSRSESLLLLDALESSNKAKRPSEHCEQFLWGFAQFSGFFTVDPSLIQSDVFESLKKKVLYRVAGIGAGSGWGSGGGGLEIRNSSQQQQQQQQSQHNQSHSSYSSSSYDTSKSGQLNFRTEKNYPIVTTPPTILFHDMNLEVGESRSFKYTIPTPPLIPPTHRGRMIRFTYRLVIGLQRNNIHEKSLVIHVPVKIVSKAAVNENDEGLVYLNSKLSYDVFQPIILVKDYAEVIDLDDTQATLSTKSSSQKLEDSASEIAQLNSSLSQRRSSASSTMHPPTSPRSSQLALDNMLPKDPLSIIQHICQLSTRMNYDICKNEELVAKFIIQRNVYRLGETIYGILDFSNAPVPCYQVSVTLETHETVTPELSLRPKQVMNKLTRRVLAEFHEYVVNTRRVSVPLHIPNWVTAEFATSIASHTFHIRLEFITATNSANNFVQSPVTAEPVTSPMTATPQSQSSPNYPTSASLKRSPSFSKPSSSTVIQLEPIVDDSPPNQVIDVPITNTTRTYMIAAESNVEVFDCVVPIRVLGWKSGGIGVGLSGMSGPDIKVRERKGRRSIVNGLFGQQNKENGKKNANAVGVKELLYVLQ